MCGWSKAAAVREMEKGKRNMMVWMLRLAGVAGLVVALWAGWSSEPEGWNLRLGYPDVWAEVEWRSTANRITSSSDIVFLRWSFGMLVASVCALVWSMRMAGRGEKAGPSSSSVP